MSTEEDDLDEIAEILKDIDDSLLKSATAGAGLGAAFEIRGSGFSGVEIDLAGTHYEWVQPRGSTTGHDIAVCHLSAPAAVIAVFNDDSVYDDHVAPVVARGELITGRGKYDTFLHNAAKATDELNDAWGEALDFALNHEELIRTVTLDYVDRDPRQLYAEDVRHHIDQLPHY